MAHVGEGYIESMLISKVCIVRAQGVFSLHVMSSLRSNIIFVRNENTQRSFCAAHGQFFKVDFALPFIMWGILNTETRPRIPGNLTFNGAQASAAQTNVAMSKKR